MKASPARNGTASIPTSRNFTLTSLLSVSHYLCDTFRVEGLISAVNQLRHEVQDTFVGINRQCGARVILLAYCDGHDGWVASAASDGHLIPRGC